MLYFWRCVLQKSRTGQTEIPEYLLPKDRRQAKPKWFLRFGGWCSPQGTILSVSNALRALGAQKSRSCLVQPSTLGSLDFGLQIFWANIAAARKRRRRETPPAADGGAKRRPPPKAARSAARPFPGACGAGELRYDPINIKNDKTRCDTIRR